MGSSLVRASRSVGEMRGVRARIALAASQIAASRKRYGADRPWGFADPTSWKCSPRLLRVLGFVPGRPRALASSVHLSDWSFMHDELRPLVTSGARRDCGWLQPGGAYFAVPLAPDRRPVEELRRHRPTVH
jgi:hypothetical protein